MVRIGPLNVESAKGLVQVLVGEVGAERVSVDALTTEACVEDRGRKEFNRALAGTWRWHAHSDTNVVDMHEGRHSYGMEHAPGVRSGKPLPATSIGQGGA